MSTIRIEWTDATWNPVTGCSKVSAGCPNCYIVGGESGPGARPMAKEWVEDIRHQCGRKEIPFFFKQWGGSTKKQQDACLILEAKGQMQALSKEV